MATKELLPLVFVLCAFAFAAATLRGPQLRAILNWPSMALGFGLGSAWFLAMYGPPKPTSGPVR